MQEMIDERRTGEKKDGGHDLFSLLLDASEAETDGTQKLMDGDIIGPFAHEYKINLSYFQQETYSFSCLLDMRHVMAPSTRELQIYTFVTIDNGSYDGFCTRHAGIVSR